MKRELMAAATLFGILTGLVLAVGAPTAQAAQPAGTRPNVLIIMADDMGYSDIGCYGGEIKTPNLDALAANGVRFTQFYNTARCCPTRASLLTGLYPHQAGVGHMVADNGLPGYRGFLNERSVTIAEALRPAGYATGLSGKWHVGERRPHWPVDRGFDQSYALVSGGTNYYRLDPGRIMAINDQQITPGPDWFVTDWITDSAVSMVDEFSAGDRPFFVYVAYTAPHWPLHAKPADIARYRGKYMQGWDHLRRTRRERMEAMGLIDSRWALSPRDSAAPRWEEVEDKDDMDLRMAVYAAQISHMDRGIGEIVERLRRRGELNNTLILFLADNGGCAEKIDRGDPKAPIGSADSFTSYRLPWANASNTPFRTFKHWVHEGGISTPLIAHWPAGLTVPGRLAPDPGHVIDLLPTALDAAGASYPAEHRGHAIQPVEGRSLLPVIREGRRQAHDAIFWEHEGNRAVRQGNWKLVSRHRADGPGAWELYDLKRDRSELHNLAAELPGRVSLMDRLWHDWAARAGVEPWPLPRRRRAASGAAR